MTASYWQAHKLKSSKNGSAKMTKLRTLKCKWVARKPCFNRLWHPTFNCLIEVLRKGSDSHWLGNSHGVPLMRSQMTWARRSSLECQNFCSLVSRKLHHWVKTSENRFISDPQKTFCRSLACSLQFEIISARFTIFIFPNVCKSASHHIAGTPEYLLAPRLPGMLLCPCKPS